MEVLHSSAKGRRLAIENDHFSCALQSPILGVVSRASRGPSAGQMCSACQGLWSKLFHGLGKLKIPRHVREDIRIESGHMQSNLGK